MLEKVLVCIPARALSGSSRKISVRKEEFIAGHLSNANTEAKNVCKATAVTTVSRCDTRSVVHRWVLLVESNTDRRRLRNAVTWKRLRF